MVDTAVIQSLLPDLSFNAVSVSVSVSSLSSLWLHFSHQKCAHDFCLYINYIFYTANPDPPIRLFTLPSCLPFLPREVTLSQGGRGTGDG